MDHWKALGKGRWTDVFNMFRSLNEEGGFVRTKSAYIQDIQDYTPLEGRPECLNKCCSP